jgi:glycopeptide antibiotics resistance protein
MAFTIYASLLPFELRPRSISSAWAAFGTALMAPPDRIARTNFLANILLFVPIGFCLTGGLLLDRKPSLFVAPAAGLVVAASLTVSFTAEFLQVFAPSRVPSSLDILAQTIGCIVGIAIWLVAGPGITQWLRGAADRTRTDRLSRVLTGYAAAWLFVNLTPFDITLDPGTLAQRFRTGRITFVPFGGFPPGDPRMLWDALVTTLTAVPLGIFGLVGWGARSVRHSAGLAFAIGAGLVIFVEAAHVFIRSHSADTADVFFGSAGVALGVAAGVRMLPRDASLSACGAMRIDTRWALMALAAWVGVLCAYHWLPYDFVMDSQMVRAKLRSLSFVPFAGYHRGSDLAALNNILVKVGLALPVGLASAFVIRTRLRARPVVAALWTVGVLALFGVVEAGQLFLPSRVPDPTDVFLGLAGSAAGLWLGRWMQADRL